jgi:hypothetical protein
MAFKISKRNVSNRLSTHTRPEKSVAFREHKLLALQYTDRRRIPNEENNTERSNQ